MAISPELTEQAIAEVQLTLGRLGIINPVDRSIVLCAAIGDIASHFSNTQDMLRDFKPTLLGMLDTAMDQRWKRMDPGLRGIANALPWPENL